jgi:hypothetical protein
MSRSFSSRSKSGGLSIGRAVGQLISEQSAVLELIDYKFHEKKEAWSVSFQASVVLGLIP